MTQLSNLKISKAQPKIKSYTLADGEGLYLQVDPNGSKLWRFRFYWQGVPSKISFGVYPLVDLKTARILRNDAKALLARGIDPREERKQVKRQQPLSDEAELFDDFAQEWMTFKIRKLGGDERPQGSKSTIKHQTASALPAQGFPTSIEWQGHVGGHPSRPHPDHP